MTAADPEAGELDRRRLGLRSSGSGISVLAVWRLSSGRSTWPEVRASARRRPARARLIVRCVALVAADGGPCRPLELPAPAAAIGARSRPGARFRPCSSAISGTRSFRRVWASPSGPSSSARRENLPAAARSARSSSSASSTPPRWRSSSLPAAWLVGAPGWIVQIAVIVRDRRRGRPRVLCVRRRSRRRARWSTAPRPTRRGRRRSWPAGWPRASGEFASGAGASDAAPRSSGRRAPQRWWLAAGRVAGLAGGAVARHHAGPRPTRS